MEEGLERGYRMKGRKQEGEEKRGDQVDTDGGRKGEGPINRRALSQSRKTAKLHLPF